MTFKKWFLISVLASAMLVGCTDDGLSGEGGGDQNPPVECEGDDCGGTTPEVVCGDGVVGKGEACDEGKNKTGGCSEDCTAVTPGWRCDTSDGICVRVNCGNGVLDDDEACDEGTHKTDGCSSDCKEVTPGWHCTTPGEACASPSCGDGEVNNGEQCDNGKENVSMDSYGFKGDCRENCTFASYCGDGVTDSQYDELCDDGDAAVSASSEEARNGYNLCTDKCRWSRYYCGDGIISNGEQCDDGNRNAGDGCSAECKIEAGYYCVMPGEACSMFKCGNGVMDMGEACDDGNRNDGDGCSSYCQPENGYVCPDFGKPCEKVSCDSKVGKGCDDGNREDGDGCASNCQVEPGWICPDMAHCYVAGCGDGFAVGTEACDDGNSAPGDGCDTYCRVEPGYVCPPEGGKCHLSVCGDGIVEGDETCDEGVLTTPANATEGCKSCRIQMGWQCKTPGASCTNDATCGNGIIEGAEECDEGTNATAGCVGCIISPSWRCPEAGKACIMGKCGDGALDKGEQCDDGNFLAGDGCDPVCKHESIFSCSGSGECKPICGDGITMWMIDEKYREECDDGNTVSGDGCSADCKVEEGWKCTDFSNTSPDYIEVPVNYYDFINATRSGAGDGYLTQEFIDSMVASDPECSGRLTAAGNGFPDFQRYGGAGCDGMVYNELDRDGKPVLRSIETMCTNPEAVNNSQYVKNHLSCAGSYHYWYRYTPKVNRLVKSKLMLFLKDKDKGLYQFDSAVPCSDFACGTGSRWAKTATGENMPKGNFVPLMNAGYCETGSDRCPDRTYDIGGFTTEVQTYFQYKGGEELRFQGNDDVWVFLNNKLFVDLGGMQGSRTKTGVLKKDVFGDTGRTYDPDFEVYEGGIYSVKLFNAERMMTGSSFQLSLSGFVNAGEATCSSKCGDGVIVGGEECDVLGHVDDEVSRKAGCSNCIAVPYCPNGKREGKEECDGEAWCDETCHFTDSKCGDGVVAGHEQCDEGEKNGQPGATCALNCMKIGCGNGILEEGEQCDDGNDINEDNCTNKCTRPKCGDGVLQTWLGEVCDDGVNDGGYNGCGLGCSYIPPRCGDGVVQEDEGEVCDLGGDKNTGAYGTCTDKCQLTDRCGDGIVQPEYENCDDGEENGQPDKCPAGCIYVIY